MRTTSAPRSFDVTRWVRDHLSRDAGNMVERIVLMALGTAHGPDGRYVLIRQITEMTGVAVDLVDDVIADAIERGEVRRDGRKLFPVQAPVETRRAA